MPELPEVEIAARNLSAWLAGKRIAKVHVSPTRVLRSSSAEAIVALCSGKRVRAVERRGKWLRIIFDGRGGGMLYSHLGMTGKWVRRDARAETQRFERVRFDVAGGPSVRYLDPRLFGRLIPAHADEEVAEWALLGRDPLHDGLDARWLGAALLERRAPIKIVLLDQALIAGLGNIQATEALWRARIHPERPASALRPEEVRRLVRAISGTLRDTLRAETGPEITYVEERGAKNPFVVYGRSGTPCPRCRRKLARKTIGGRTTAFCPSCQR